jgi:hypothetical protein
MMLRRMCRFIVQKLLIVKWFPVGLGYLVIEKIHPADYMDNWTNLPFNAQPIRMQTISTIYHAFNPQFTIETGTHIGSSTTYLAAMTSGKTFTIEIEPKYRDIAMERFTRNHPGLNIESVLGDSATQMRSILEKIPRTCKLVAYLDAHWLADIPTYSELEALIDWGGCWIAIIDDFKVDTDSGYKFDSYGSVIIGKNIVPTKNPNLEIWVPNISAARETGARSGTGYIFSSPATYLIPDWALQNLQKIS